MLIFAKLCIGKDSLLNVNQTSFYSWSEEIGFLRNFYSSYIGKVEMKSRFAKLDYFGKLSSQFGVLSPLKTLAATYCRCYALTEFVLELLNANLKKLRNIPSNGHLSRLSYSDFICVLILMKILWENAFTNERSLNCADDNLICLSISHRNISREAYTVAHLPIATLGFSPV